MEADAGPNLVDGILQLALGANVNKNLQYFLKSNVSTPNTAILRQALHASIHSGAETNNKLFFEFAATLSKLIYFISPLNEDQAAEAWSVVTTGDINAKIYNKTLAWSWEKFFDWDIRRRKKLNVEERHQSMKTLYNAKLLSIFRAKYYPKVLFTLLKLGADPFEKKPSKKNNSYTTLTMAIVKSKKISKEKRLHLLFHLAEKKLLRADRCGPKNTSPVILCIDDQTKYYALPYVLRAGGFEKLIEDGINTKTLTDRANVLAPYLSVEHLKIMLAHPQGTFETLYAFKNITNLSELENFTTAVKELLIENPSIKGGKLIHIFPVEFLAQYSKDPAALVVAKKNYYKNVEPINPRSSAKFNGDTEFTFEHLPPEISELICTYLPTHSRTKLFSLNKAMKNVQLSFGEYFWRSTLKTAFPILYKQVENDETKTWHEKTLSASRSTENWRNGRFTKKIITSKIQHPSHLKGLTFDERWLTTHVGADVLFWNCVDDSIRPYRMPFSPEYFGYLNSTMDRFPDFVASTYDKIYYHVNDTSKKHAVADIGLIRTTGLPFYVAPISQNKFLVGPGIFDVELDKVVTECAANDIHTAKKHVVGENIIAATLQNLVIYDQDFREVAKLDPFPSKQNFNVSVNILDENLVYTFSTSFGTVTDLRTMKVLHYCPSQINNHPNSTYRTISSAKGIGTVWNLKNNTWECAFPLPNGTSENPICNSKYAVFASPLEPRYSKLVVLDFDPTAK